MEGVCSHATEAFLIEVNVGCMAEPPMDGLWVPSDAILHFHQVYYGGRVSGLVNWRVEM